MSRTPTDFEQHLEALIKPLNTAKWEATYHWDRLESGITEMAAGYGGLEMVPDFQRGHVWTEAQQIHFLENCLRGVVPTSGLLIQFNCPTWREGAQTDLPPGFQCIDGLQRYSAVSRFMHGEIKVFGLTASELKGTRFDPRRFRMSVAMHDFVRRTDLLEHYLALNAGGTVHTQDEIDRVRALLAEAS